MTDATTDQLEILNLYSRYTHAIDYGDAAGWVACFTDDGVFDRPRKNMADRGKAELTKFVEAHLARPKDSERHVTTNIQIDVDDDTAKGLAYLSVVVDATATEAPKIRATGRYHDTIVRTPAGWRFSERVLQHDGFMG